MEEEKLFSFAVLTYRHFDGVIGTVESVFAQDYPQIELILADDGSDNYETEIGKIREYIENNKPRNIVHVQYLRFEKNQGLVKNMNQAIKGASGYYFKGMGTGDKLACPDALSKYVHYLEENQVRIVFAKLMGVTPDGKEVRHLAACEENYDLLRSMNCEQLRDRLFSRNCLPAPAWCTKKELFEKDGLFHEDTRLIEDYSYWITLCNNHEKIGFMDDVLVCYELDGISSAGSYSTQFMKDLITIYDKYIFPADKRMGVVQPVYNALKRGGLNAYMAKAEWKDYNAAKKLKAYAKYGLFFGYIWVEKKKMMIRNRKG